MKTIIQPIRKKLPPIKLYFKDIESVYNILKQITKEVEITTKDKYTTDVKELRNIEEKSTHYLLLHSNMPYINIEFRPYQGEIYFSEDTIENRGILSKIEDILYKCKVPLGSFFISIWFYILNFILVLALISLPSILRDRDYNYSWIPFVFLLLPIIAFITSQIFESKSYSTVMFIDKKEESSFWKRNKDKIIVGIITTIFGTIIGAIIGSLITYLLIK